MSKTKVMISVEEDFLTEIDKIADQENRSRTDILKEAVGIYLKDGKRQIYSMPKCQCQKCYCHSRRTCTSGCT